MFESRTLTSERDRSVSANVARRCARDKPISYNYVNLLLGRLAEVFAGEQKAYFCGVRRPELGSASPRAKRHSASVLGTNSAAAECRST